MSRLSGAVGAVKGFHAGTVRRDDVLATIDDALLNIQRFKSIELPESRARVDLSQEQAKLVGARTEALTFETGEKQEFVKALKAWYPTEEQAKTAFKKGMAERSDAEWEDMQRQEKMKPDLGLARQMAMGSQAASELQTAKDIREIGILQQEMTTKEAANIRNQNARVDARTKLYGMALAGYDVKQAKVATDIAQRFNMPNAQADSIVKQAQAEVVRDEADYMTGYTQYLKDNDLMPQAFQTQFDIAINRTRLLEQQGKVAEANALMTNTMLDYANSPEGDKSMLFGWYGRTLRNSNQPLGESLDDLMKQFDKITGMSGVSNTSLSGTPKRGAMMSMFDELSGILVNEGKLTVKVGKDEFENIDLKDAKEARDRLAKGEKITAKQSNALNVFNNLNAKVQLAFEGMPVIAQLDFAVQERGFGLRHFGKDVPYLTIRYTPIEYLEPADVANLPENQQALYAQQIKAHEREQELKPLVNGFRTLFETYLERITNAKRREVGLPDIVRETAVKPIGTPTDDFVEAAR